MATPIQLTEEYPDLVELRRAALVRQKLEQQRTQARKKRPTWDLLKMVVWKNLVIRKRRKTQFLLLLFQVVLWFGIACFSIVLRSGKSVYESEPYAGPSPLTPRIKFEDLQHPIALTYNKVNDYPYVSTGQNMVDVGGNVMSSDKEEVVRSPVDESKLTGMQVALKEVTKGVLDYFKLTYDGLSPPIHVFDTVEDLIIAMREDRRLHFGVYFDKLDLENREIDYQLLFWEREVPVDEANGFDCRKQAGNRGARNAYGPECGMELYGRHGFVYMQTAISNAIIQAVALREGLSEKSFIISRMNNTVAEKYFEQPQHTEETAGTGPFGDVLKPTRFRLEFPGVSVVAERFPEHAATRSHAAEIAISAPFYFMFALISVFSFVVMDMVAEKESMMKAIMKTYGLSSGMFWLSWLATYALLNVLIVWCALFICGIGRVFGPVTSIAVVAVVIYVYLLSLITLGFLISVFFQRAQTATVAGMAFNILLYGLGWLVSTTRTGGSFIRAFAHLFSTITFSITVIDLISMLPDGGVPFTGLFNFREHSVGVYVLIMIGDTLLYALLAWYLDQAVRSDWGSSRHWTFIFDYAWKAIQRRTRKGRLEAVERMLDADCEEESLLTSSASESNSNDLDADWVEPVSREVRSQGCAVRIRGLTKSFPSADGSGTKTAVDNLNLDMYRGEIFGLLGHNGAGKTTTISMLTGMLQLDSGDAKIMGHSIRNGDEETRKLISVCPQQNLFFEDLTCLEHLIFFAALRGMDVTEGLELCGSPSYFFDLVVQKRFLTEQRGRIVDAIANLAGETEQIQRTGIIEMEKHFNKFGLSLFVDPDINFHHTNGRTIVTADTWSGVLAVIEKVGLSEKMFSFPSMLSGGMKRRLWLAIALIGDPKVVFLDEPTSGVDPLGRQELWRLIQDEKVAGRCIIITTHHMEEADVLADRKAIMTAGRLRCVGSSLFLKSRFGIGYYLEIEVLPNTDLKAAAIALLEFIRQYVPNANKHEAESNRASAAAVAAAKRNLLLFQLPLSSVQNFSNLFLALEASRNELRILEYGVALSTLEEVFFRLGEEEDTLQRQNVPAVNDGIVARHPSTSLEEFGQRRSSVLAPRDSEGNLIQESAALDSLSRSATSSANGSNKPEMPERHFRLKHALPYGVPGDLVSQKFQETNRASAWKFLRSVITLRYLQISHNKLNFLIDVTFPILMLLTALLFREQGQQAVDLIKPEDGVPKQIDDYSTRFNSTIPFSIDNRLIGTGLEETYRIIAALPKEIRDLMQRVDILPTELLIPGMIGEEDIDDEEDIRNNPMVSAAFRQEQLVPDMPRMGQVIAKTPINGRAVRNALFLRRDPVVYGEKDVTNKYAAGLSFEPRSSRVNQDTRRGASEFCDGSQLQVRVFYDAGIDHALPMLINIISDAVMNAKLDNTMEPATEPAAPSPAELTTEFATGTPNTVVPSTQKTPVKTGINPRYKVPYHVRLFTAPLFIDIPIFVTAMTYRMYIMLSLGLSSLPARFGIQIMLDKFMGTKHAMIVMGLPTTLYWLGSFAMNYLAMVFGNLVVCGFVAYFIPIFWSSAIIPVVICLFFYSASVLLWSYFLSQLFYNLKAYTMTLQLAGMLLALCPAYLVSIFSDAAHEGAGWGKMMWITHIVSSLLFPPYNPIGILIGCAIICSEGVHVGRVPPLSAYFALDRLPIWSVICSFAETIILFSIIVIIDKWQYAMKLPPAGAEEMLDVYYQRRFMKRQEWLARKGGNQLRIPESLQDHKDDDVLAEDYECMKIRRILNGQEKAYRDAPSDEARAALQEQFRRAAEEDPTNFPDELPLILIDDLHYLFFPSVASQPPHVAVRSFSLSVYRGEIFGLLGPNGAGKTTSIKLLTCNYLITAPTRGAALLGGHDVSVDPTAAFMHLGLCPQFDALWGDISVRDNLKVFARIKNVPENKIDEMLDYFINNLELTEHQHKRVQDCSGGNKRRVSVAVAFMGNPDVVLMDEPSSGIDPVGRKRLAELIHQQAEQRCVLVTTHSMEEAEVLCSRIGIIVNGELNCLNTSLAIRNRYGAGVHLEVIFDDRDPNYVGFDPSGKTLNPWQLFVRDELDSSAVEIDHVANRIIYDIPLRSSSLGRLFGLIESRKDDFAIKAYALSQPTLEQVFITFAKRQRGAQESAQEIVKN